MSVPFTGVKVLRPSIQLAILQAIYHDDSAVVIGILANSGAYCIGLFRVTLKSGFIDTLTFYAAIVGIMRLGYIPFPISVRNSAPAVAHLMKTTNAKYLIISGDPSVQAIADLVCHQYDGDSIITIPMPKFNDIYSCDLKTHEPTTTIQATRMDANGTHPALIRNDWLSEPDISDS